MTRSSRTLNDALKAPTPTITQIEFAIQEFDKRLAKLDEVQETIEVKVPEEELDTHLDEAHDFRTARMQPRILAEDKIKLVVQVAGLSLKNQTSLMSSYPSWSCRSSVVK